MLETYYTGADDGLTVMADVAAGLVFLIWGYLYAIECTRTYRMSYYYLERLTTFLLIWMPAARVFSLDALLFKDTRSETIPFWPVALLRGQLVTTYFHAGLAKVNADWLLDAMPVREFVQLESPKNGMRSMVRGRKFSRKTAVSLNFGFPVVGSTKEAKLVSVDVSTWRHNT